MQESERSLINAPSLQMLSLTIKGKQSHSFVVKQLVEDIGRAPGLPLQKMIFWKENDTCSVPKYLNSLQDVERERQIPIQDVEEGMTRLQSPLYFGSSYTRSQANGCYSRRLRSTKGQASTSARNSSTRPPLLSR